ncbi:MAG: hypothetical protein OHK0015_14630 [Chloroflexi bacterium OHK40]
MTEQQSRDIVDILSERLGVHYYASIDDGRARIVETIAEELRLDRARAEETLERLLEAGRIRYVTGTERDVVRDVAPRDGDHSDHREDATNRSDSLVVNAIPGAGGPQQGTSGLSAGAVAPVAAGGTSSNAPGAPLAAAIPLDHSAEEAQRAGYWDFSEARGVVPSDSRKGQVEPAGI